MRDATLSVSDGACEGCVDSVREALEGVSGVASVEVFLDRGEAPVRAGEEATVRAEPRAPSRELTRRSRNPHVGRVARHGGPAPGPVRRGRLRRLRGTERLGQLPNDTDLLSGAAGPRRAASRTGERWSVPAEPAPPGISS